MPDLKDYVVIFLIFGGMLFLLNYTGVFSITGKVWFDVDPAIVESPNKVIATGNPSGYYGWNRDIGIESKMSTDQDFDTEEEALNIFGIDSIKNVQNGTCTVDLKVRAEYEDTSAWQCEEYDCAGQDYTVTIRDIEGTPTLVNNLNYGNSLEFRCDIPENFKSRMEEGIPCPNVKECLESGYHLRSVNTQWTWESGTPNVEPTPPTNFWSWIQSFWNSFLESLGLR